jgi:hypothetical protein
MNTTRTLLLAGFAALSLGVGSAMAQESAGGYIAGPYDQQTTGTVRTPVMHYGPQATVTDQAPQYGSADRAPVSNWPVMQGGDGS